MSSNLKVNTILPSTGTNVAIGTAGGSITMVGNVDIDINSGISTFNDIHISDKIVHDGDINTSLRFPAADTITAETGGSERLRIDSGGRLKVGDNTRPASDANEGAGLRVTSSLTRNQYYSPHGHYFGSIGYADYTNTKAWLAVDSAYAQSSAVSAGIFLSAFHQDAGGSGCGFTIKNLKDGNPLVISSVVTAASTSNPAVETERLRITSAGLVGIGTAAGSSSSTRLVVYEESGNAQTIEIKAKNTGGVGSQPGIRFTAPNNDNIGAVYGDVNTDSLRFATGTTERLSIGSNALITATQPNSAIGLIVKNSAHDSQLQILATASNKNSVIFFGDAADGDIGQIDYDHNNNSLAFVVNTSERLRIASNGQATFTGNKVKINGGTTGRSIDVETTFGSGGEIASFQNNANNAYGGLVISGGEIDRECRMEAAWGNGFFTYWTNNAERMRIDASGHTFFSQMTSLTASGSNKGINIENNSNYGRMNIHGNSSAGNALGLSFYNNGNNVGTIYYNTSSTAYNTSSDYRLKENEVSISDGITRLKSLKPYRFNFKVDPDKTVDGFFAHEVAPVIPEAVTGEKDAEDMQQMDQSKLVPLLTAALQEAIAKIETLETKVAALEGS